MNTVQVIQLSDNSIYLIGHNNEYLLVDTGPNYKGAWAHIQSEIKTLQPNLVFITHGHHDHASLGSVWQNSTVPVWIGTADQQLVHEPVFSNPEELRFRLGGIAARWSILKFECELNCFG